MQKFSDKYWCLRFGVLKTYPLDLGDTKEEEQKSFKSAYKGWVNTQINHVYGEVDLGEGDKNERFCGFLGNSNQWWY